MSEAPPDSPETAGTEPVLPTIEQLCLELPLYTPVVTRDRDYMQALRREQIQFDAYCTGCKQSSTFKTMRSYGGGAGQPVDRDWMLKDGFTDVELTCQRLGHKYLYCFRYVGGVIVKYGQIPSLEDIAGADIARFKPVLKGGYFAELKRATGLASHGIGIGSFVYLRRIFEHLIVEHHAELARSGNAIEGFSTLRMDDKIGALKSVLPPALVRNKAAYSILSSGIHALDEDTCRRYFPVVRAAIIEILEQDLRAREEAKAAAALEVEIAKLLGEVKAANGPAA